MFVSLAAIWGASFLFMRIAAPVIGALWTAQLRITLAALVLALYVWATKKAHFVRPKTKEFWILGAFNTAFPFALFSYAALSLPAGYLSILNAIIPLFAAIFSIFMLGERLTWRVVVGSVVAMSGIALMVQLGPVVPTRETIFAVLACGIATVFYGFSGVWSKKYLAGVPGVVNATNSQLFAAISLLPLTLSSPLPKNVPLEAWAAVIALAVVCSAMAYLMFFKLLETWTVTRVASVSFLIPVFGIFWGWLILNEPVTINMVYGFILILIATALTMGVGPFAKKSPAKSQASS